MEQALRQRVQDFYTLMQASHYEQAESFVTPETRKYLHDQSKGSFLSFSVSGVKFDQARPPKRAEVSVIISTMHPPIPTPMPVSFKTNWVFTDGNWFVVVPTPPSAQESMDHMLNPPPPPPRSPDEIQFADKLVDMGTVKYREKGVARFAFKNTAKYPVTLEVDTHCDCLIVKNLKKEYLPNESSEFVVEFDPAKFAEFYGQSLTVHTKPGNTETLLTVKAYVPRDSGK